VPYLLSRWLIATGNNTIKTTRYNDSFFILQIYNDVLETVKLYLYRMDLNNVQIKSQSVWICELPNTRQVSSFWYWNQAHPSREQVQAEAFVLVDGELWIINSHDRTRIFTRQWRTRLK
jgi:hypothetical protein